MTEMGRRNQAERPGHFLDELRVTFANRAGRPAILHNETLWTYGDLEAKARRCAARLRSERPELAEAWRAAVRHAFRNVFDAGYCAVQLSREDSAEGRRVFYVLERKPKPGQALA